MYVKVLAAAGAKKESVEKLSETSFEIAVREPAERNLANRRIAVLIAQYFNVPVGSVRIINGHHSQNKMFSIEK